MPLTGRNLAKSLQQRSILFPLLDNVLDSSLGLAGTGLGNIQIMDWELGCLEIAAQRGFRHEFLEFFERVKPEDGSACAHALRTRHQIVIRDVANDKSFSSRGKEIVLGAGVRAVQSTPIVSSSGAFVGMLSTHYPHCRVPSPGEMKALAALAQQTANTLIAELAYQNQSQAIARTRKAIASSRELLARVDKAQRTL